MNTHHVFYNDAISDGIGFSSFPDLESAIDFINARLAAANGTGSMDNYTLISGTVLPLEARTVVTKVRVNKAQLDAALGIDTAPVIGGS